LEPKREEGDISKIPHLLKELSKLTKTDKLDKVKASVINQFLRGELFVAADYYCTKRLFEARKDIE
jgi:hypothetical protein